MDGDLGLALLFALRRPRDKILEADGRRAAGSTMVPRLWLVLGPVLGVLPFPSSILEVLSGCLKRISVIVVAGHGAFYRYWLCSSSALLCTSQ